MKLHYLILGFIIFFILYFSMLKSDEMMTDTHPEYNLHPNAITKSK